MKYLKLAATVLALAITGPALAQKQFDPMLPADVIAKYGKPDRTSSSEYEKPRPPLVTKMMTYEKEHVRVTLLAGGKVGDPPPYKTWNFLGYQDPRDNKILPNEEVRRRMHLRLKK